MADLSTNDKKILEKLFQITGYVLNFTNRTFADFFKDDLGVDIYADKYGINGTSKANHLRAFWEIEDNELVGKSIKKLIEYIENQILLSELKKEDFSLELISRGKEISAKLRGFMSEETVITEDELSKRDFKDISITKLKLDPVVLGIIQERINEIKKCLSAKASLAVIFLCGSTLEGILLGVATNNIKAFNTAVASPKDKVTGEVKPFQDWTLNDFINVSRELKFIGEDVKKFSHAMRDFRNYIHPYEQMSSGFSPDEHTAKICSQVLLAAIAQLSK